VASVVDAVPDLAYGKLLMRCEQVWLDATDVREMSRHIRQVAKMARTRIAA
jgi:hypothetical protein